MVIIMKFKGIRTDLAIEQSNKNLQLLYNNLHVKIYTSKEKDSLCRMLYFSDLLNKESIKSALKKEIYFFLQKIIKKKSYHVFVIGLGNENNTADSVGPKVLKYIQVNAHLKNLEISNQINTVSALEPGVLGTTGINTKKIIESVSKEIKPDFLLLIDSYVSKSIDYLNKSIQITDKGITPGSGMQKHDTEISFKTVNLPVLVIGIPTAIEVSFSKSKKDKNFSYLVSTYDIDLYVTEISKIIGEVLNEIFYDK